MPASTSAIERRGILSIWNDMDAEHEDFYERWYMTEHFPERLGVPGFRRGRRYEAVEADRRYFTFYELDSPDVLFSNAYLARLAAPTAWTQRIMTVWKDMVRTVCERVERAGHAFDNHDAPQFHDEGAARALLQQGKSLLPIGVIEVEGEFPRGAVVACIDPRGRDIARGLVNYDADDARRIARRPSREIESILGYVDEPELIHRDNLVLL